VNKAVEMVKIGDLEKKGINEKSGGEEHRVFSARTEKAKIILPYGPSALLDIQHQILMFGLLKKLNEEEGITTVTISNDLNPFGIYSGMVALLHNGRIVMSDNKSSVMDKKNIKEIIKIDSALYSSVDGKSMNVPINPVSTSNQALM